MTGENLIQGLTDLAPIGHGGFATVYRAYDPRLDRVLAVKIFNTDANPRQFSQEISAMGRLGDHPNIAEIINHGVTRDGRPYFTMPLYSNGSLSSLITESGPLSVESTLRTGVKICGALATAHAASIIHGDVKPANILITRYDDVVLADFGVARLTGGMVTNSGPVAVTLAYAPPEVVAGSRSGPSADIYSLGMTLYVALVGEAPLAGDSVVAQLAQVVEGINLTYPEGRHPGPDIEEVLTLCVARRPDHRPSPLELAERLRSAQRARGFRATDFIGPTDGVQSIAAAPTRSSPHNPEHGSLEHLLESTALRTTGEAPEDATRTRSDLGLPPSNPGTSDSAAIDQTVSPPSGQPPPPPSPPPYPPPPPAAGHPPKPPPGGYGQPPLWPAAPSPQPSGPLQSTEHTASIPADGPGSSHPSGFEPSDGWWQRESDDEAWHAREIETFAPDRPTTDDRLGYEPLVKGIVQLLTEQATSLPLTIGVAGQWGAGKTSLMLQVRDRLAAEPGSWTVVWFDAWKYQGRDSIWAGLARAIYTQAQASRRRFWGRALFRLDLERRRRGAIASVAASCVAFACVAYIVIQSTRSAGAGSGWPGLGALGAAVATIGSIAAYFGLISAPFERAVARGSATRQYDAQLGISDTAERDIEHLLAAATAKGRRVAVFLDDVDRCNSATILETLTTITEIFGRRADQAVAFVLGVDMEMVVSAVHEQMSDLRASLHQINERRAADLGASYLEKIFQLTVHLDGFGRVPVERLLAGAGQSHRSSERLDALAERLKQVDLVNPGEITEARRRIGLSTVMVAPEDLGPLRAAVRQRRADLLNPRSSRHVLQAEILVMRGVRMTPRAAKRFDNAFRLQLQVANGTEGSELDFDPDSLLGMAKWVGLRMFFPRLTSQLDGELGLLGELESLARDPGSQAAYRHRVELLGMSTPHAVDLRRLLSVGPPASSVALLPLDTFATIV